MFPAGLTERADFISRLVHPDRRVEERVNEGMRGKGGKAGRGEMVKEKRIHAGTSGRLKVDEWRKVEGVEASKL